MCLVSFSKTDKYSALKKVTRMSQPAWAYFHICDNCSHKCPWCYGGFNHNLNHYMRFEDFRTTLKKLKEIDTLQVTLSGGEPTEHPDFRRFVAYAAENGFLIHVATHGEHIDREMAGFLKNNNVEQVQFNWQGKRYHDQIHGVTGAYEKARQGIRHALDAGMEVTTTITVGRYNLPHIDEIMQEAAALGVSRLRVWEATGLGNAWRKGVEAVNIFERCREAAEKLGYDHTLSYDPIYTGDVTVPCIQLSNLTMCIDSHCKLVFCKAVPEHFEMVNFLDLNLSGEDIRQTYLRINREVLGDRDPYCAAREGLDRKGEFQVHPVKWMKRLAVAG